MPQQYFDDAMKGFTKKRELVLQKLREINGVHCPTPQVIVAVAANRPCGMDVQ